MYTLLKLRKILAYVPFALLLCVFGVTSYISAKTGPGMPGIGVLMDGVYVLDISASTLIAYKSTEASIRTAITGGVYKRVVPTAAYTLTANLTIPAGVEYAPLLGAIVTPHYSIAGGGSNWTVHSGSVYVSTANYNEIEFLRESGTALTEVAGAADIDAAGKWAWEGNKIYVRTTGSVDPDTLGAGLLVAGHILTFATGSHLEDNGGQMFSAAAGEVVGLFMATPEMFGAIADSGTTDNTSMILAAIGASNTIIFSKPSETGYYKITDEIAIAKDGVSISGQHSRAKIVQVTTSKAAFKSTANNTTIKNLEILGPQHASFDVDEIGVYAYGASFAAQSTGLNVENCIIHGFGFGGVYTKYHSGAAITNNEIYDTVHSGYWGFSSHNSRINNNYVHDITPGYGVNQIAVGIGWGNSDVATQAEADAERSSHNEAIGNIIKDIIYEGILLEPSLHTTIADNIITNCPWPIAVQDWASGGIYAASQHVTVTGNVCKNISLTADTQMACVIGSGSATYPCIDVVFTGNTIWGYGNTTSSPQMPGLYLKYNNGLNVIGNNIRYGTVAGIKLHNTSINSLIALNNLTDFQTGTVAGIYDIAGGNSSTVIEGNVLNMGTFNGFRADAADPLLFYRENNTYIGSGMPFRDMAVTANRIVPGRFSNISTYTATGSGDLYAHTITAGSMGKYGGLKLIAAGSKAGAAGTKEITLNFGAGAYVVHAAANDANDWRVAVDIVNSGATNAQRISWTCFNGATVTQGYEDGSVDTTADVTLKLSVVATGPDTVVQRLFDIHRF